MASNENDADVYGDFEEVKDENALDVPDENNQNQGFTRVRLPRGREVIGRVMQRLGGNRMEVKCTDGKTRNSRIPGRFKRRFYLREKDYVIVEPWEFDDSKADIIHQYRKGPQVENLKKSGKVDDLKDEF